MLKSASYRLPERAGFPSITMENPESFVIGAKNRGLNLRHLRASAGWKSFPYRPNLTPHPEPFKAPSLKSEGRDFVPAAGELGSWVTFGGVGTVFVRGQVWAMAPGSTKRDPRVWVVDQAGRAYDVRVSELREDYGVRAEQLTLTS